MTNDVVHRLADDEQMPKTGTLVGDRYEILGVLGEGGFAAVYKALDSRTMTEVAVKVLDPLMSRRTEFSERFLREVQTVSRLRHHNTIKIFDSGETSSGCLYLVMELLTGRPLDEIVKKEGSLTPERVGRISVQVLKSLYEAHELGIIHRDLKPANIFIADLPGERDYVKVLDFGIAKTIDESQNSSLTATGQVMCSPDYVAPERVRDHVAYPASDIYSLGIMMVELLEGEPPYKGESPMMVAMQHLRLENAVPLNDGTMHSPLGPTIQRACAKGLADRYASAGEMIDDLLDVSYDVDGGQAAPRGEISTTAATRVPDTVSALRDAHPSASSESAALPAEVSTTAATRVPGTVGDLGDARPSESSESAAALAEAASATASAASSLALAVVRAVAAWLAATARTLFQRFEQKRRTRPLLAPLALCVAFGFVVAGLLALRSGPESGLAPASAMMAKASSGDEAGGEDSSVSKAGAESSPRSSGRRRFGSRIRRATWRR